VRKLHPALVILMLVGGLAGALTVEALTGSPWAVAGIVVAGIGIAVVSSLYIGDLQRGDSDG
jgi:carbon starvation protein CstA